jgi:Xaa-Pro dipeptidase
MLQTLEGESMTTEFGQKLSRLRLMMAANNYDAVHLAQLGNLSWLLCGADLVVSLISEPIAEAVVTSKTVTVVAPNIEQARLEEEELPKGVELIYVPWYDSAAKEKAMNDLLQGKVLSDTSGRGFDTKDFWPMRVPLTMEEIDRYRKMSREASQVLTEGLQMIKPGLSEHQAMGLLAEGLIAKGMQPVVMLAASDDRLERHKHPLPSNNKIDKRFMAVSCVRKHGLITSLTRLISFGYESAAHKKRYTHLLEVEKTILDYTKHGLVIAEVFREIQEAYAKTGRSNAWSEHHQGGPIGYYTRDFIATPEDTRMIVDGSAYAWNPSLPGVKVEDTILLLNDKLEVLTEDPRWPLREVGGRLRPEVLEL